MAITLEPILSTTANWLVTNINPDGFTATAGLLSTILLGLLILALEETDDKKKRPVIRLALMRDFFLIPFASGCSNLVAHLRLRLAYRTTIRQPAVFYV